MSAQIGDTLIYKGDPYTMQCFLPILTPEFLNKYDIQFKWQSSNCWRGCSTIWEIVDDKLYLVAVNARADITDKLQYREEKLRLRKLLRQEEITPQQNGHMLKAYYKEITFNREVDVEYLLGKPAPLFADWVNKVIPIPKEKCSEWGGILRSYEQFLKEEFLCLHIKEGKLIKKEFYVYGKEDIDDS